MRNHLVNPILTNYLVPRNERFNMASMKNKKISYQYNKGKKSEKTTNTSDLHLFGSYLKSPEPYSLNESLQNESLEYEQNEKPRINNTYEKSNKKKQKKTKIDSTFNIQDSDLVDSNFYVRQNKPKKQNFELYYKQSNKIKPNQRPKYQNEYFNNSYKNPSINFYKRPNSNFKINNNGILKKKKRMTVANMNMNNSEYK